MSSTFRSVEYQPRSALYTVYQDRRNAAGLRNIRCYYRRFDSVFATPNGVAAATESVCTWPYSTPSRRSLFCLADFLLQEEKNNALWCLSIGWTVRHCCLSLSHLSWARLT